MTTGQLVDVVITHFINSGSGDSTDTTWRQRVVERAQETVDDWWDENDWRSKLVTTTASLTSGTDSVDAPSDFDTFTEHGGLFIQSGGVWRRLTYINPARLYEERENNRDSTGCPRYYTDAQIDSSYLYQITFDITADQTYSLRLYYESNPPILLDRPTALTATAGSAGNVNGTVIYRVTAVGVDGTESELGPATTATASNEQMNLASIYTGGVSVVSRKIYRTVASGSTFKLLTTISDNSTTTYTDNTADGSLGATATATTTASSLERIPLKYQRTAIQMGTIARVAKDFGDMRAFSEFDAKYEAAKAKAKSRSQPGLEDPIRIGEEGLAAWGMH